MHNLRDRKRVGASGRGSLSGAREQMMLLGWLNLLSVELTIG